MAIAIGNPLGYENTVTTGIVSGLGRQIQASDAQQTSAETLRNLIQTDAAINPGNSGGPLVNSAGQVIGINTAVSTEAQGLGFAIPIDVAKPIMQQAIDGEELVRPWIGVFYTPITPAIAEAEGLPVENGALIGSATDGQSAIFPDSPAESAGLRDGDIIVAMDGEQITAEEDLATLILPHAPGDTITLRVLRESSTTEVEVTLGTLPAGRTERQVLGGATSAASTVSNAPSSGASGLRTRTSTAATTSASVAASAASRSTRPAPR